MVERVRIVLLWGKCGYVGCAVQSIVLSEDRRCRWNTYIAANGLALLLDNRYFVVDVTSYTVHEYAGRRRGGLLCGLAFMRKAKKSVGQSVCQTVSNSMEFAVCHLLLSPFHLSPF